MAIFGRGHNHNPTETGTYQLWLLKTYWVSMSQADQPHLSPSPQHPRCFYLTPLGLRKVKKKQLSETPEKTGDVFCSNPSFCPWHFGQKVAT